MNDSVITGLIAAAGAAVVALIGLWSAKAKARSESASTIISEWRNLLELTRADLAEVKERLSHIEKENSDLVNREGFWVVHVNDWRRAVPDRSRWPRVPEPLRDRLSD